MIFLKIIKKELLSFLKFFDISDDTPFEVLEKVFLILLSVFLFSVLEFAKTEFRNMHLAYICLLLGWVLWIIGEDLYKKKYIKKP